MTSRPAATATTQLEVDRASKSYGGLAALDGVSFRLSAGEWIGLVGPNGAGKTSLLRLLCGLAELDQGRIVLHGPGGERLAPRAARPLLGLVPQEIALYPALSARENLEVFGRLHGVPRRELGERIAWALAWTGLERRAAEPVDRFSGGMQRRLNIACGVLHTPRVVLLDEPTVGVDPQGRQRIWQMLEELRDGGASLLQSSHQLDEIESRCDRLLILDHGRLIAAGTVAELAAALGIGRRRLTLTLDRRPDGPLGLPPGVALAGDALEALLGDPAGELEAILKAVRRAGLGVRDLHLEAPGLEEIFTRLTGRGLRE